MASPQHIPLTTGPGRSRGTQDSASLKKMTQRSIVVVSVEVPGGLYLNPEEAAGAQHQECLFRARQQPGQRLCWVGVASRA